MIKLTCKNKRHKPYTWVYNGKGKFYASCPKCKGSVKIIGAKK